MSEDLLWNVALLALLTSLATSVYLWFFKRQRSGLWIWISYSIRAAWGGFLVAIAHIGWTVLKEDIPLDAVAAFVVPILLVGATFLVPWGLVLRRLHTKIP